MHTDLEDFEAVLEEVRRVLRPGAPSFTSARIRASLARIPSTSKLAASRSSMPAGIGAAACTATLREGRERVSAPGSAFRSTGRWASSCRHSSSAVCGLSESRSRTSGTTHTSLRCPCAGDRRHALGRSPPFRRRGRGTRTHRDRAGMGEARTAPISADLQPVARKALARRRIHSSIRTSRGIRRGTRRRKRHRDHRHRLLDHARLQPAGVRHPRRRPARAPSASTRRNVGRSCSRS
jgi:hypothetical protein